MVVLWIFFFKQKTAYDMRCSDWSSDVCSSDLVILSGRRINDGMGAFIAARVVKMLGKSGKLSDSLKVGILGLAFKENVRDLRNSRVPDIVGELREYGIEAMVYDPMVDPEEAEEEFGIRMVDADAMVGLNAMVLCVPHSAIMKAMNPCTYQSPEKLRVGKVG